MLRLGKINRGEGKGGIDDQTLSEQRSGSRNDQDQKPDLLARGVCFEEE